MKSKKLLTTIALASASFTLVACQPLDNTKGEKSDEKSVDAKADKAKTKENKVLSEEEYVVGVIKQSYDLVFALEALSKSIPEETVIEDHDVEKIQKQAKDIIPVLGSLSSIQAPEKYKKVQKLYKEGADELSIYIDGFIEEFDSLISIDTTGITPHFEKGVMRLAEAETELYKLYGKDASVELNHLAADRVSGYSTTKDETKEGSSESSYKKEDMKGTWEYFDESTDTYTNVEFGDYGYGSKYVGNPDGSSTTWAGSWHLDGNTIVIDVEEAYQGFDENLDEFEKELRFDIVSKKDKELTVKHKGETITFKFLY